MKKLSISILAIVLSVMMAACGVKMPEPLNDNSALPDVDGYAKTDNAGTLMYTDENTGSVMVVQRMASDAASIKAFASKNDKARDEINTQLTAQLSQMIPGSTASGDFTAIEGKDVFAVTMDMSATEASGLASDSTVIAYMLAGKDEFVTLVGMGAGDKDIAADMAKLVKAL